MPMATINVISSKDGYFPEAFVMGGSMKRVVLVDAVEHCWTEMARRRGSTRHHFRVRCGVERFRLSEDCGSGRWTVKSLS